MCPTEIFILISLSNVLTDAAEMIVNTYKVLKVHKISEDYANYRHLSSVQMRSRMDCAGLCSTAFRCSGYSYLTSSGICQTMVVSKSKKDGSRNYQVKFYIKGIECGEAPNHIIGAVTTNTCKSGFIPCSRRNFSICQSTGRLEDIGGQCDRSRWRNPRVDKEYLIPCRPVGTFKVVVGGEIKGRERFNFNFMAGTDILLHIDFRLHFGGMRNRIATNDFIDKVWGKEKTVPYRLENGEKIKILITASHGTYKLTIDGSVKTTFTSSSHLVPSHVVIVGHISPDLLQFTA